MQPSRFAVLAVLAACLTVVLALPAGANPLAIQKVFATGDAAPGTTSVFGPGAALMGYSDPRGQIIAAPLSSGGGGAYDGLWIVREDGTLDHLANSPTPLSDGASAVIGCCANSRSGISTSNDEWYLGAGHVAGPGAPLVRTSPGATPQVIADRGDSLPWYAPPGGTATLNSFPQFRGMIGDDPIIGLSIVSFDAAGTHSFDLPVFLGEPGNGGVQIADQLDAFAPGSSVNFGIPTSLGTTSSGLSILRSGGSVATMDATGARTLLVEVGVNTPGIGTPFRTWNAHQRDDSSLIYIGDTRNPTTNAIEGGLFSGTVAGVWNPVIEYGAAAPGTSGVFDPLGAGLIGTSIGDGGRIWATARVDDGLGLGLWSTNDDDSLRLAMREGDTLSDGELIDSIFRIHAFASQKGALVSLRDDDGTRTVFTDGEGFISTIFESGEAFTVAVGDDRIVSSGSFSGRFDGSVVLHLLFTDGTEGVFLATIPEPGTGVLVSLGLLVVGARRRRC